MRTWTTTLLLSLASCGDGETTGDEGDDDTDTDTDGGIDTDTDIPVGTGPNTSTTGSSQQCLLLFGAADRVVGQDIFLPEGTEAREIQVWVRTRSVNREMVAFSYGRPSSRQGLYLGTTFGGFPMLRAGMGENQLVGTTNIADDEWHHLVATWQGGLAAIVLDGVVDAFDSLDADTLEGEAVAGNSPIGDLSVPWHGWVDDVKVFEGAREPEDIALDPEGATIPPDKLKLWWDFEVETGSDAGGSGIVVPDLSGNGPYQDGTSVGTDETPWFPDCR
jgi:hypothetical protein